MKAFLELIKVGIIHRNIKADNILISSGVFKVTDYCFGSKVDILKEHT